MADEPAKRRPSPIFTVVVAIIAALVVNIAAEGLGEDPLRRLAFLLVFATLGAVGAVIVIEGLGALWRRASSQDKGTNE